MSIAGRGGEFGKKLAKPHEKKPPFVFIVSIIILVIGFLIWKKFPEAKVIGIIMVVFGGIGIYRGWLLLQGKDFSKDEE